MVQYKKKSPEAKKKEVESLTKDMESRVESYFQKPEQLKEYLDYMGRFHNYSVSNAALIESQFPSAEAIGSFKFWKDHGFSVQKGEKGIKILVPNKPQPKFKDEEGKWKTLKEATAKEKKQMEQGTIKMVQGRLYFTIGHVFDVSQTDATAKDLPTIFPNRWLEGSVKDFFMLQKGMEQVAENNGIRIIEPINELGAAKGVSYTNLKAVALNPRNTELQNVKTLLHELAHAKLHTTETHEKYAAPEKEFQAEMTAYTVASYFGIDTSEYSLSYLASWTEGRELKDKTQLLKEVHDTSMEFIDTIEEVIEQDRERAPAQAAEQTSGLINGKFNEQDHIIALNVRGTGDSIAVLNILDGKTDAMYSLPVMTDNETDRNGLYIDLAKTNAPGSPEKTVMLESLLSPDMYEKVQAAVFDQHEQASFLLHDRDLKMSKEELVQLNNWDDPRAKELENESQTLFLVQFEHLSQTSERSIPLAILREAINQDGSPYKPMDHEKMDDQTFIKAFNQLNQERFAVIPENEIKGPSVLVQWSENENLKSNEWMPFGEANKKMMVLSKEIEGRGGYDKIRYHIILPKELSEDNDVSIINMDRLDLGDGFYKSPLEQIHSEKNVPEPAMDALKKEAAKVEEMNKGKDLSLEKEKDAYAEALNIQENYGSLSNTVQLENKKFLNHLKEVDPDAHKESLLLKTLNEKQSDEMEKQLFNTSVQTLEKKEEKQQAKKPKAELELGM